MNKELIPLEALKYIVGDERFCEPTCKEEQRKREKCIEIVKNALKEREQLQVFETIFCLEYKNHEDLEEHFEKIEKKLKALEIIKNRAEDEQFGLLCLEKEPSGRYCLTIDTHIRTLTKEEYDLLKEVLL